jgi:hypothetical protein
MQSMQRFSAGHAASGAAPTSDFSASTASDVVDACALSEALR